VGRGGDHLPFQELGFPAVRLTVAVENYDHQHQDIRREGATQFGDTIDFMDFSYLAKVTSLNIHAAAALAAAPVPPTISQKIALSTDTQLSWTASAGAAAYRVWRRRTDASEWEAKPLATTSAMSATFKGLRGDDWFFGVSALAKDGSESPVASAVPGGAYMRNGGN